MKKTIFTVIVAVLAAAFFMVGNSFAEDQEQEAQENIISTADCTAQGTGTISGVVTDACTGEIIKGSGAISGVWVRNSLFGETYTQEGVYVLLSNAGSGTLTFIKTGYLTAVKGFQLCSGTSISIDQSLSRSGGCPKTTSTTTSVAGCK